MQVKKFEAKSMKEALELIKTQLGPDAIILSVRDNNKSYGLVGEGSVEVTAAVSEETLHKKKFVESKMRGKDLEQFNKIPARAQKQIINKVVHKYTEKPQPRPVTTQRYIEIDDEGTSATRFSAEDVAAVMPQWNGQEALNAKKAAAQANLQKAPVSTSSQAAVVATQSKASEQEAREIKALKEEIASLRNVITQFQEMPQNFLGSHPGADYGIPYDLSWMFEKLCHRGVSQIVAAEILTVAQEYIPALKLKNKNIVEAWVAKHILETSMIVGPRSLDKVQVFVGPAGGGKTTAMVKLASHLLMNERKKIAILTTDTFKVGATDQMRIYAQILNVPFAIIRNQADWSDIMKYLAQVDCVLVDMPSLSLKTEEEVKLIKSLLPPALMNPRIHYVASVTSKDSDITESAKRYRVIGLDDVIFTSLDESSKHGSIYNFTHEFKVPVHSFGIGPSVPEDFEMATKERILDLIFKLTTKEQGAEIA